MVLPVDPSPSRARCATCRAPYIHGQPIAHAVGCAQGARVVTVGEAPTAPKVKPVHAGLAPELALAERLNEAGLVGWEAQFYWALSERTPTGKPRQYRADFAYPKAMLLVEVEGQVHAIKAQRAEDCARASLAAALGYRMVRVTKDMIVNGDAVRLVGRALEHGRAA